MGKIITKTKLKRKKQKSKTALDLAIQVSDRIELKSVRLMGCECQQMHLVGAGQKGFEIERKTESSTDEGRNRIFILAHFTLKTNEIGAVDKEPFAIIKATFLLIYKADSLEGITNEAVEQFGKTNGVYNAWPYWREFVQNTIVRMNLPTLTIPVFRLFPPTKPKRAKKKVVSKKIVLTKKKRPKSSSKK